MLFWSHEVWGAGLRSKVLEPESQVENRSRVKWGAWANQSGGGFLGRNFGEWLAKLTLALV
jgi:hypothetical protein